MSDTLSGSSAFCRKSARWEANFDGEREAGGRLTYIRTARTARGFCYRKMKDDSISKNYGDRELITSDEPRSIKG
jgi:hypothetical protein